MYKVLPFRQSILFMFLISNLQKCILLNNPKYITETRAHIFYNLFIYLKTRTMQSLKSGIVLHHSLDSVPNLLYIYIECQMKGFATPLLIDVVDPPLSYQEMWCRCNLLIKENEFHFFS